MVDKFTDKAEGAVDKAKGQAKELSGDAIDDQTRKAQGTIDQGKGEAKQGGADGTSNVEEAADKITGN
ncbi:MAG: CsbD family protein [Chloroflexota bacterium]|nr:CsbD family protein [Chloroflexota bacterium]